MIGNNPGMSSYFRGYYRHYGLYQWNIKYYDFQNYDTEIEAAQEWAFGWYDYKSGSFETINQVVGRLVKASIQGRSGGWFVVDTELSEEELKAIDDYIQLFMDGLPSFLAEERQMRQDEEDYRLEQERKTESTLKSNKDIQKAIKLIQKVTDCDATLVVKGIKLI